MKQLVLALTFVLSGCASASMLPKSVSEVDFHMAEGKTGWSQYREIDVFRGYTADEVFSAAKVGLGESGFALRSADRTQGVVIGEHGITLHDWNVIAGVYFKEVGANTEVAVLVEGSKDTGFSGDVTGDGWTGKILSRMRNYLRTNY